MADDGADVLFDGGTQIVGGERVHPGRCGTVPQERVPLETHPLRCRVAGDRVAGTEIATAPDRLDDIPLHLVFGGEIVELPRHHRVVLGIDQKSGLDGGTDESARPAAAAFSGSDDAAGGGAGAIGERSCPQAITVSVTARTAGHAADRAEPAADKRLLVGNDVIVGRDRVDTKLRRRGEGE